MAHTGNEDLQLLSVVRDHCRARPPILVRAGQLLDRQHGLEATRRRLLRKADASEAAGEPAHLASGLRQQAESLHLHECVILAASALLWEEPSEYSRGDQEKAWEASVDHETLGAVLILGWLCFDRSADECQPHLCEFQQLPWSMLDEHSKFRDPRERLAETILTPNWYAKAHYALLELDPELRVTDKGERGEAEQTGRAAEEDRAWLYEKLMQAVGRVKRNAYETLAQYHADDESGLNCDEINESARRIGLIGPSEFIIERRRATGEGEQTAETLVVRHPNARRRPVEIQVVGPSKPSRREVEARADDVVVYLRAWAARCEAAPVSKDPPRAEGDWTSEWIDSIWTGGEWDMPGWPGGWESLSPTMQSVVRTAYQLMDADSPSASISAGLRLIELVWARFEGTCDLRPNALPKEVASYLLAIWVRAGRALEAAEELAERHRVDSTPLRQHWMSNTRESVDALTAFAERLEVLERINGKPRDQGDGADALVSQAIDELVTLDQAAAVVQRSKKTLERYLKKEQLPKPDFPGGGGKAHRWYWSKILPSLKEHFRADLPDRFPGSRPIP